MSAPTRSPYSEGSRKLVLAFDIGTTYSGVSYSILDPGKVPEIKSVQGFQSGQSNSNSNSGDSKVPTVIYYDKAGKLREIGAGTRIKVIEKTAKDNGWFKAEWFKLHMRPTTLPTLNAAKSRPLPPNKSAIDLFADIMRYLHNSAKDYIKENHASGPAVWDSVADRIDYVLSHPNGWEGVPQDKMRKAAVLAGLIPDTPEGHDRIQFVTEGEASLHFCIQSGFTVENMKDSDGLLIVDAGGGTIDISAYAQTTNTGAKGPSFAEVAVPQCHLEGSVIVRDRARDFVKNLLKDSEKFNNGKTLDNITEMFDTSSKLTFRDAEEDQYIDFGGINDTDPKYNIDSGELKLSGKDVASFFTSSIECIIQGVKEQKSKAKNITAVLLVGGFAANPYLFTQLKIALEPLGFTLYRPRSQVKAVADGAISFYLDHFVGIRMSKFAYGVTCSVPYIPFDIDHRRRSASIYRSMSGIPMLPGKFDIILRKGVQVSETTEFRRSYSRLEHDVTELKDVSTPIRYYRGTSEDPEWVDVDRDMYSTLCFVHADTEQTSHLLTPVTALDGTQFYRLSYDIILSFGLTEFKAQICWMENGVEKRGPAKIVYESDPDINEDVLQVLRHLFMMHALSSPGSPPPPPY